MCNPREVVVTATRMIDEAWQHAVSRTVVLDNQVTGEARVRERLDASLATPVLRAFEMGLANDPAWTANADGYRHDVEGGYVVYHLDDRSLEIVATSCDVAIAEATVQQSLAGHERAEVQAEGIGGYYTDGYGGTSEETARRDAQAQAERKLEEAKLARLEEARQQAEAANAGELNDKARQQAEAKLQQRSAALRAELDLAARRHLDTVGVRARQVFYRSLGGAYRDAILSYARRNHAEGVHCHEEGDVIEIEFLVER